MKKNVLLIVGCLLWSIQTNAQADSICECYAQVKLSDALDSEYLKCLAMHREAVSQQDDEAMKLMRAGKSSEIEEMQLRASEWKDCFKPEVAEINSELIIQFTDYLGKEVDLFFDVDFTDYNEFNKTGYLKIEFANYDRMTTWSPPDNAFIGSVYLVKNDSLSSPLEFASKTYQVKNSAEDLDEFFYINYDYLDYSYNGGFHKAQPMQTSTLTVNANNGRYIELEFTHINEQGEVLKGTFQCIYPFTAFD